MLQAVIGPIKPENERQGSAAYSSALTETACCLKHKKSLLVF